jgi:HK97 family phage prohead protease
VVEGPGVATRTGPLPLIVGYAAVYDSESLPIRGRYRERIPPGVFARALGRSTEPGRDLVANIGHDATRLLARTGNGSLRFLDTSIGLWVEIDPNGSRWGRHAVDGVESGDYPGMSVLMHGAEHVERGSGVREVSWVHRIGDVCIADRPAYPATCVWLRRERRLYPAPTREQVRAVLDRAYGP